MPPDEAFDLAVAQVRALRLRPELTLAEAPAPRRMAPQALAITGEVGDGDDDLGDGRFVALHNPHGEPAWEGNLRLVAYVDAAVESEMAGDPLLPSVGWTWLMEALEECGVSYRALGGTVTRVHSESFGDMDGRATEGRVQIRASWTGLELADLATHVEAWAQLLGTACGLEPLPDGVTALRRREA